MNLLTQVERERQPATDEQEVQPGFLTPDVDMTETPNEYVLEAEMPGVNKEGLEVLLDNNELTIIGRRSQEKIGDAELVYRESNPRDYRRVFVVDPTIDTARIGANMRDGVLILHLPKAEQLKPRKIVIE